MTQFDYSKQDILKYGRAEKNYLERNPEYKELLDIIKNHNFFQVEQQNESFKVRGLILMNDGIPEVKPPYKARHINLESLEEFMLNERLQFTEEEFITVHEKFREFFDEYSPISLSDLFNASYVVYTRKKRKERTYTEQMQVICNNHLPIEVENEMEHYFQRKFVNLKDKLLYFETWEESKTHRGNSNGTHPQNLWKNYKNEIEADANMNNNLTGEKEMEDFKEPKILTRPEGEDITVLDTEDFNRAEIKLEKTEPYTIPTEERENNNHMREMANDLTPKKIEYLTPVKQDSNIYIIEIAEKIHAYIRDKGQATGTNINKLFRGNKNTKVLKKAINHLKEKTGLKQRQEEGNGRATNIYYYEKVNNSPPLNITEVVEEVDEKKPRKMKADSSEFKEILKRIKDNTTKERKVRAFRELNDLESMEPGDVLEFTCSDKARSKSAKGVSEIIDIDVYNHNLGSLKISCLTRDSLVARVYHAKKTNKGSWTLLKTDTNKRRAEKRVLNKRNKNAVDYIVECLDGKCLLYRIK